MNRKIILSIFSFLGLCLLSSCTTVVSQAPVPAHYELSTQQVMQSVHHWDILAEKFAKQTKEFLEQNDLLERNIYIKQSKETLFEATLYQHLVSRFLQNGINVIDCVNASDCSGDELLFEYSTIVVNHGQRDIKDVDSVYYSIAPEVIDSNRLDYDKAFNDCDKIMDREGYKEKVREKGKDVRTAKVMTLTNSDKIPSDEVVVSCSVTHYNNILFKRAVNYYIAHEDKDLYKVQDTKEIPLYHLTDQY